jgi:hypothetical protein
MQLLKKASIRLFVSIVGASIALPSIAFPYIGTGGVFPSLANAATAPTGAETIGLADLLAGKTYGNIVAPEDYSFESSTGNVNLVKGMPISFGSRRRIQGSHS